MLGIGRVTNVSQRDTTRGTDRDVSIQLEEIEVGELDEPTAVNKIEKAVRDV